MPLSVPVRRVARGTRRQPEASREAILLAALSEFAQEGVAGARMDAIASAAGVNKALLYYYFQDKESLHGAVLETFFFRLRERILQVLERPVPPGERLLYYVREHFDFVAESSNYARLFLGELASGGRGGSPHLSRLVEQYIRPIAKAVGELLQQGIDNGEFRSIEVRQFLPTVVGVIVHYFVTVPLMRKLRPDDPLSAKAIQERRAAVLEFIAAGLFVNQKTGLKLASQIAKRESHRRTRVSAAIEAQRTGSLRGTRK